MFDVIQTAIGSAVADNGTFTVGFPTGRGSGSYTGGANHKLIALGTTYSAPKDFTLAFTTLITVTWKADVTIPAGTLIVLQVDRPGPDGVVAYTRANPSLGVSLISLGAPIVGTTNSICLSQSLAITPALALLNGATGGVLDVPRNVIAAWTTTAILTITGKDEWGNLMVETSASGATHLGKKAFKSITSITSSAAITGLTVGSTAAGGVLGLPYRLPGSGFVLAELQDGVAATAGTFVAADTAAATGTTGDVRGTYAANATLDGAKSFQLIVAGIDPADRGVPQFAG